VIQFYLLSVVLNLACGYALISSQAPEKSDALEGIRAFARRSSFRLVAGVLSCATALFKLLTVMDGDIPVIGDFFPALAGFAAGFALLLEYYCLKSDSGGPGIEVLKRIFFPNRRLIGIAAIAAGIAHFVFPRVILL
jgi:hypothetical protein